MFQGIGTLIQYINRDETQHTFGIVVLIKKIMGEYNLSHSEVEKFTHDLFTEIVTAEKALSASFFEGYAGINTIQTQQYVEFRANSILGNIGFEQIFTTVRNPMRWITAYDSTNLSNQKDDFFEKKVNYYSKPDQGNGFDDL